jgi:phenylpropionate dioxygenase-like ring-hydroxylating dioxygenase large terminal subunit
MKDSECEMAATRPPFLLQAWYMAAWEKEVDDRLFARTILNEPILLFRDEAGRIAALLDRCPHRFAPLSLGRKDGGEIVCGYHGLRFDAGGRCVGTAYGCARDDVAVRAFPVACRDGAVWIWMGDGDRANPEKIPKFPFMSLPGMGHEVLHFKANYELVVDNLMDPTHTEFLHPTSFGTDGAILEAVNDVALAGDAVISNWTMPDAIAPRWVRGGDRRFDRWVDIKWFPPASIYMEIGACAAGAGRAPTDSLAGLHILTPESDATTHYFFTTLTDWPDPRVRVFNEEDRPMIEGVQSRMKGTNLWAEKPVVLQADRGAVLVRKMLAKMIASEDRLSREVEDVGEPGAKPQTRPVRAGGA